MELGAQAPHLGWLEVVEEGVGVAETVPSLAAERVSVRWEEGQQMEWH